MLRVLTCLTQEHDFRLVFLAALVCVAGCWIAVQLFVRTRRAADNQKLGWMFLTGVAAGSAVWTTHFLAMLGFDPAIMHGYDPMWTLVSWFLAIFTSTAGFGLAASNIRYGAELGGAAFGAGVGAMHYAGMNALIVPGMLQWDASLIAWSILFGTVFAAAALHALPRPSTIRSRSLAVALLTLAIVSLHFTGMGAVTIVPDPSIPVTISSLDKNVLALGVTATMVVVVGTGIAAYTIDRKSEDAALAQYRHLAFHDTLTSLPNRSKASEVVAEWLEKARISDKKVVVVGIDLNRFKDVNDVYGHSVGDELLRTLGEKLGLRLENHEMVARIGGDEFLAVKLTQGGEAEAFAFARRLIATISEPIEYSDRILNVGASCGVAIYPDDGVTTDDLILRADLAMYRAKNLKLENICRYSAEMDEQMRHRSELSLALREAAGRDELVLYYQPQTNIVTGELTGFEALLRWNHPERGIVQPSEFIPIIEETGLILPIGEWVLRTACEQAAKWPREHSIAVNVSPAQFSQSDFARTVHECLLSTGLKPSRLELEITETMLIDDFERTIFTLRQLKTLGVRIAMDDFGTGYSSLSTLQSFPFDKLKIDRSFTQKLDSSEQSAMIVRAVIGLARNLKIPVLAEGVESVKHIDFLKSENCDEMQGFLISHPLPEAAIQGFMDELDKAKDTAVETPAQTAMAS